MTTPSDDVFPAVIIGAGLAGLTAAIHLAERDVPPLILEADRLWAGGRLSGGDPDTFEYGGRVWSFTPDHGVHALWGGYDNLRAMLEHFLHMPLIHSTGEEWVNRWGRAVRVVEAGSAVRKSWLPAPFHYLQLLLRPRFWRTIIPLDFLSLPGFLASILLTIGLDPLAEGTPLDGLMLNEYFRGWTPNLRATFVGLAQNLLAAPADSISLAGFLAALRFYTLLRRDSWQLDYFPGNSHDHLVRPLIEQIEARGGMLLSGAEAIRLEQVEGGWKVIVHDSQRGGSRSLMAARVILAVNASAAQRLLSASPATAPQADKLRFPPDLRNVAVRLWFDRAPREGTLGGMMTGDFEVDNFFWLHRLYAEFADWRDQGYSAAETHIYGTVKKLEQSDKNLLILAVTELQRAFPELRGHFVHGVVRRNSQSQSQFRIPTHDSLHVETPWSGVYACGDWVGYPTTALWMERATVTGIAAANHVLQANGLEPFPILAPKPPERLVRALSAMLHFFRRVLGPGVRALLRILRRRTSSI